MANGLDPGEDYTIVETGWPAEDGEHFIEPNGYVLVTRVWDEVSEETIGMGLHRYADPEWPLDWQASISLTLEQARKVRDAINRVLGDEHA